MYFLAVDRCNFDRCGLSLGGVMTIGVLRVVACAVIDENIRKIPKIKLQSNATKLKTLLEITKSCTFNNPSSLLNPEHPKNRHKNLFI